MTKWPYAYLFGIILFSTSAIKAYAQTGSVLPSNLFDYGLGAAGLGILAIANFMLLRQNERITQTSNDNLSKLTTEIHKLNVNIEGKLIGKN